MSLVIETQFAALTVDANGDLSNNDVNNNNLGAAADSPGVTGAASSTLNMSDLGDSLPEVSNSDGHGLGKARSQEWIRSCKFGGTQPFRFRMRVDTKMMNLKRAYLRVTGISEAVFIYKGKEVGDLETPFDLGMENGFKLEIF